MMKYTLPATCSGCGKEIEADWLAVEEVRLGVSKEEFFCADCKE